MKYALSMLLLTSQIVFTNNYVKTIICYDKDIGHSEIWLNPSTGKYTAVSYMDTTEVINPISIGEALQLPNTFQYFASTKIKDMFGLVPDIKYNYICDLDTSAKVLNTYLLEGWNITKYEADPYAIYVELHKGDEQVRLLIYENLIKIYDKRL